MTDKLYYKDAYLSEFDASVISSEKDGELYRVVLDRTAFFPEEGGQSADGGYIDGIPVVDVKEKDGVIYHILEHSPDSKDVHCALDFAARFEKMQCHTAEHILCGIIHRLYGYENVGFHLGADLVTFDVDGELTAEQIAEVELLANRAVFENHPVYSEFPTPEELRAMEYRAKLDLTENVRIVSIEDIDKCACCAPHVSKTGEIGMIKIVDFMRHRGGMRLFMQAGYRALEDYRKRYYITRAIGAMTSTPSLDALAAVEHLVSERDKLASDLSRAQLSYARALAELLTPTDGNAVCVIEEGGVDAMRELANAALDKVGGILVVLSGESGSYKYVMASRTKDLRALSKEINTALSGRGGGRCEMITGSLCASLDDIRAYFEK